MEVDPSLTPLPSAAGSRRITNPGNSNFLPTASHHTKSDSAEDTVMPSMTHPTSAPQPPAGPDSMPNPNQEPQLPNHWSLADQAQIIHHFKIIDYGLADFKELFGAGYVRSDTGHQHKHKQGLYRGSSLGKMAVPVTDVESAQGGGHEEGYMRAARPVGCVAFLPHPSKLLPKVTTPAITVCKPAAC